MALTRTSAVLGCLLVPLADQAAGFEMPQDEAAAQFIASNVVAIFYHEVGHAFIDILDLPVLGKEEDAADTLSALLTHYTWQEEGATQIVYDTSKAFLAFADETDAADLPYWDSHSLDMQRYYNLVCLYYGAEPELRDDAAKELGLPDERAEICPEEFAMADESWGVMLQDLEPGAETRGLRLETAKADDPIEAILAEGIATLNATYGLPEEVVVRVEACGEANAFYDSSDRSITLCREYAEEMLRLRAK